MTVCSDSKGRTSLKAYLQICFDGLDTFGKTPDQLGNAAKLMVMALADFPVPLVRNAFEKWVRTKTEMPKPADIVVMIEGDNSQLLDYLEYVRGGGNLADFAEVFMTEKLGNNWRKSYV